jgi:hypothetical protein
VLEPTAGTGTVLMGVTNAQAAVHNNQRAQLPTDWGFRPHAE